MFEGSSLDLGSKLVSLDNHFISLLKSKLFYLDEHFECPMLKIWVFLSAHYIKWVFYVYVM